MYVRICFKNPLKKVCVRVRYEARYLRFVGIINVNPQTHEWQKYAWDDGFVIGGITSEVRARV